MKEADDRPVRIDQATTLIERVATVGVTREGSPPTASIAALTDHRYETRYRVEELLGEGGMGTVVVGRDERIGRRVAIKRIRQEVRGEGSSPPRESPLPSPGAVSRFLREACVQGQLEHPAIAPVYDLGCDEAGVVYFTMKRIRGLTIADVIGRLADNDEEAIARYGLRRLLESFVRVCQAIEFAHERGVIHRDLKPDNIMLGDHGEVYVLDWGVARVLSDERAAETRAAPLRLDEHGGRTVVGDLIGTPGYMAPEQAGGQPAETAADVYALGAVLFELLTLEPLLTASSPARLVMETLSGVDGSPSRRAPHRGIAPELDALCVEALARDPAQRPTVSSLRARVERYLDGEQDAVLRRELAARHLRAAHEAMGAGAEPIARRGALQEIARALALQPDNPDALRAMVRLVSERPRVMPPEVEARLTQREAKRIRRSALTAAIGYSSIMLYVPLLCWAGIRDRVGLAVFFALAMAATVGAILTRARPRLRFVYPVAVASNLAFAVSAKFFGPLVLAPLMLATNAIALSFVLDRVGRRWVALMACLGVVVPLVLELTGVLARSYAFVDGRMIIEPGFIAMSNPAALVMLAAASIGSIVTGVFSAGELHDELRAAEREMTIQAWQLWQLVPEEVVETAGTAP